MPGPRPTLTRAILREHLRRNAFRCGPADRVGVEVELTPLAVLDGRVSVEAAHARGDELWSSMRCNDEVRWRDGLLSREPGGQWEYSGRPLATPEAAARSTSRSVRGLCRLTRSRGFELIAVGVHPWASPAAIGLRASAPRYLAMQEYFRGIGPHGARMMRQTGSIQVAIDHAHGRESRERWELAQRLGPVLATVFANGAVWGGRPGMWPSLRALAWSGLDPSRTGIPPLFLSDPESDPVDQYLDFALRAALMFIRRGDGSLEVVPRGPLGAETLTFDRWLEEGHRGEYPAEADWADHLGVLFPNVRPQGYLEVRTIDAPGVAWLGVPILLIAHALRDAGVRAELLRVLRPAHSRLQALGRLDELGARGLAESVFEVVLSGLVGVDRHLVTSFYERYTRLGRTPGIELAERIAPGRRLDPRDLLGLERERRDAASADRS